MRYEVWTHRRDGKESWEHDYTRWQIMGYPTEENPHPKHSLAGWRHAIAWSMRRSRKDKASIVIEVPGRVYSFDKGYLVYIHRRKRAKTK